MYIREHLGILTIVLMGALSTPLPAAQIGSPSSAQISQSSYSDQEIRIFAEALLEIDRITRVYQPRLEAAKTPVEEDQVREAALNAVTTLLEQKGINVDKYREILLMAQNNPEIAQRIRDEIKKIL